MDFGGVVVRRIIPSDNSCLFNAVGYVMENNKHKASELRQVIAATVMSDPVTYSEAVLGKPNEEYSAWIMDPEKWGGNSRTLHPRMPGMTTPRDFCERNQLSPIFISLVFCKFQEKFLYIPAKSAIELAILSDYYAREIAAYDIQTTRCDLYGQGKGYGERVMLIYDGLHYDSLALSPVEGAPEEIDQTIFPVGNDRTIGVVGRMAENLVQDAHRKRNFTDTSKFTLRCGACQIGVVGQKEAVEHAKQTGHTNFQEYR